MREYNYSISSDLYHHGIKGMRWGVRRFQDKNGRLTSAGKKRYSDDTTGDSKPKKSKHRLKLEEEYRKLGLSEEEARKAADKRIKTEKILAASAAVAVTACAAYIVNKKLKDRIDGVIKAGESLQRIEMQDTGGKLHEVFYAAQGEHDKKRYAGLLGLTRKQQTGHAYIMELMGSNDVKVASKDHAAKVFGDLYKNDPSFRKNAEKYVRIHFSGRNLQNPENLSNRNIKKLYENFNANLINIREEGTGIDKKFYEKLKDAGYGAIQDVNDMKYSGYMAKNPLIIFDAKSGGIMSKSFKEMTGELELSGSRERAKALQELLRKEFAEQVGPMAAGGLSVAAISKYASKPTEKEVKTIEKRKRR